MHVVVNLQLSNRVFADQYYMTVSRTQVSTHQGYAFFFKFCADKLLVVNWLQAKLQVDFLAIHGHKFIVWSKL